LSLPVCCVRDTLHTHRQ